MGGKYDASPIYRAERCPNSWHRRLVALDEKDGMSTGKLDTSGTKGFVSSQAFRRRGTTRSGVERFSQGEVGGADCKRGYQGFVGLYDEGQQT